MASLRRNRILRHEPTRHAVERGSAGSVGESVFTDLLESVRDHGSVRDHDEGADEGGSARFPRISVVIPALNEAANLPFVLPRIESYVDEVLLVDGHSIDDTATIARELHPRIRVVAQEGTGKGCALRSGFDAATGDIIVMLDADCSMDPGEIPLFVGALLGGADFVKGSRFLQGAGSLDMTFERMLGNWGFAKLVRMLFACRCSDLTYGYIAFWRDVLPMLRLDADGFEIDAQMSIRALCSGLRVVEVPSFESARKNGVSHLRTYADGWQMLKMILRERFANRAEAGPTEASIGDGPMDSSTIHGSAAVGRRSPVG